METLHKSNFKVFISLGTHTSHQHTLLLLHWWVRKYWKVKELWFTLSFPFHIIIFSVCDWLIQEYITRKKAYDRVPLLSVFFRFHCLLTAFESSSVITQSMASWSYSLTHWYKHTNRVLILSPDEPLCIVSRPDFWTHGALWTLRAWGWQNW